MTALVQFLKEFLPIVLLALLGFVGYLVFDFVWMVILKRVWQQPTFLGVSMVILALLVGAAMVALATRWWNRRGNP